MPLEKRDTNYSSSQNGQSKPLTTQYKWLNPEQERSIQIMILEDEIQMMVNKLEFVRPLSEEKKSELRSILKEKRDRLGKLKEDGKES